LLRIQKLKNQQENQKSALFMTAYECDKPIAIRGHTIAMSILVILSATIRNIRSRCEADM